MRANASNITDRGLGGPDSALYVGYNRDRPGLLDVLADDAEAAYGGQPARGRRTAAT